MGLTAGCVNLTIDLGLRAKAGVNYTCVHCGRMSSAKQKKQLLPVSHGNLKMDRLWKLGDKYF